MLWLKTLMPGTHRDFYLFLYISFNWQKQKTGRSLYVIISEVSTRISLLCYCVVTGQLPLPPAAERAHWGFNITVIKQFLWMYCKQFYVFCINAQIKESTLQKRSLITHTHNYNKSSPMIQYRVNINRMTAYTELMLHPHIPLSLHWRVIFTCGLYKAMEWHVPHARTFCRLQLTQFGHLLTEKAAWARCTVGASIFDSGTGCFPVQGAFWWHSDHMTASVSCHVTTVFRS